MKAQKDGSRADALLLGQLNNRRRLLERAAGAAERAVSDDVDVLLLAEVDNFGLG